MFEKNHVVLNDGLQISYDDLNFETKPFLLLSNKIYSSIETISRATKK